MARDVQFELFVAAALIHGGIRAIRLAEPDLRIQAGDQQLGIAVKRVASERQAMRRLGEATQQLRRAGFSGFIVINLDGYAGSRPTDTAQLDCTALVGRLRQRVRNRNDEDAVGGVFGFATIWLPVSRTFGGAGAFASVQICCDAQLIVHPENDTVAIRPRLATIGRNIMRGLHGAASELDERALHLVVQHEQHELNPGSQRRK